MVSSEPFYALRSTLYAPEQLDLLDDTREGRLMPRPRTAPRCGRPVSLTLVRRVWGAVTRRPCASVRLLAAETGMAYSTVAAALRVLRAAGYIAYTDGVQGARVIVVGLYERKP
jgi:hypothetical protein